MIRPKTFSVFFRTSKQFGKNPITEANYYITYHSLLKSFGADEIIVIADNATTEQQTYFMQRAKYCYLTKLGNCGSFRLQVKLAMKIHAADIYYFVEDDHLHQPEQKRYISEGLNHFDFVSLYDHPDKYMFSGYKGLMRKIVATEAGHFSGTPSTVMTFAITHNTLIKCYEFFLKSQYIRPGIKFPQDHQMFLDLIQQGYSIGTCLPGRSTHCEKEMLSPYFNWQEYAKQLGNELKSV